MPQIHKAMFPPGSLGRALCEQREANANVHPLFQEILEPMKATPLKITPPYAVPLCCGPRHGIFVAGHCATCGKVEQHEPEPPQSDACRHSRFSIGRGKYRCVWCNEVFDYGEDGL